MFIKIRRIPFVRALIFSLCAVLFLAGNAFAQDEIVPEIPAEPAAVEEIQAAPTVPQEDPAAAEPLTEESALQDQAQEALDSGDALAEGQSGAAQEAAPQPPTMADEQLDGIVPAAEAEEALADLVSAAEAAGAELTAADGTPLNMASQASADAIASADPYFTAGGITYRFSEAGGYCLANYPGDPNCHDSETNAIQAAINYINLHATIPTNGMIYVEKATYYGAVTIDGTLANLSTLKGLIGLPDINMVLPTINNSVYIHDTLAGFTLSGFIINATAGSSGAVQVSDNTGALVLKDLTVHNSNGTGIKVANHNGTVALTNVISSANYGSGATIDNSITNKTVTISNSEFDHNNNTSPVINYGLHVHSGGLITLNYVSASHNNGTGATLVSAKGATVKNSVFNLNYSDPNNGNYGFGLHISEPSSTNAITLENVSADHNENNGVNLRTGGSITIKKLMATNNLYHGTNIDSIGLGSVSISNSYFTGNTVNGLIVLALKNITVNSIVASNNSGAGALLDNCQDAGGCTGSGTVAVAGATPNRFIDNGGFGLNILSRGNVTLSNFEASDNSSTGVRITNNFTGSSASVTINASTIPVFGVWKNILHNNVNYGLNVDSFGTISADKLLSFENTGTGSGIRLDNSGALTAKTVTLRNSRSWGNYNGIVIFASGSASVNTCSAYDNAYDGMKVDTLGSSANITVTAASMMDFNGNMNYALLLTSSLGSISADHIDADGSVWGSNMNNSGAASAKAITVADSIFSNAANGSGLWIESHGPVTLRNLVANENNNFGFRVRNESASAPQTVTLSNVEASGNTNDGAFVLTHGNVLMNGITAVKNQANGISIDTCDFGTTTCQGNGTISLSGLRSDFSLNNDYGAFLYSGGSISLANFSADRNSNIGIYAGNSFTGISSGITVNASSGQYNTVNSNLSTGLYLESFGAISVSRTQAEDNGSNGAFITNQSAASPKNVTVIDSIFNHNQNHGLEIYSKGTVNLQAVTAIGNTTYDSEIYSGVTLRDGLSEEDYMYSEGKKESWWYHGSGAVTIQLRSTEFTPIVLLYDSNGNLLASDYNPANLDDALISAFSLPLAGDYRIEVMAKNNGFGVYDLALNHPITPLTHNYLYQYGVKIDNRAGTGDVSVQPLGSMTNAFNFNSQDGLQISSYGTITIAKAEANNNISMGFNLDNMGSTLLKGITLTNVSANKNKDYGVYANSKGAIVWAGGGASGSRSNGGSYLDNSYGTVIKPVTVSNAWFNDNLFGNGLSVYSLGNIALNSVSAESNSYPSAYGVFADNCRLVGGVCQGSGTVTVNGLYNGAGFNGNGLTGLRVLSFGNIRVSATEASGNGNYGMYLNNDIAGSTGSLIVVGTSSLPVRFNDNYGTGLHGNSRGTMSLTYVEANDNSINGYGISLVNTNAATALGMTFSNVFANGNRYVGINAESHGPINATRLQANNNHMSGVEFNNSTAVTPQIITITKSEALRNTYSGLSLYSKGKITLNGITSDSNNGEGVYVDTDGDLSVLSTLGENSFSRNGQNGLNIWDASGISLSKVTADWNGLQGLTINGGDTLTITTGNFQQNGYKGIHALLTGDVGIGNVQVVNNGSAYSEADGIYIITSSSAIVKILNSMVTGHQGSGIEISGASTLMLDGTFYLGNDTDNDGQPNVDWH